jgi:hypothetical protein
MVTLHLDILPGPFGRHHQSRPQHGSFFRKHRRYRSDRQASHHLHLERGDPSGESEGLLQRLNCLTGPDHIDDPRSPQERCVCSGLQHHRKAPSLSER